MQFVLKQISTTKGYLLRIPFWIRIWFPSIVWKVRGEKNVCLTFDDGPSAVCTETILGVLKEENVPATFFCLGSQVKKHPKLLEKIIKEERHKLGGHGLQHINGWNADVKAYLENAKQGQACLPSTRLYRPPYGKLSWKQFKILKNTFRIVMWTLSSADFDDKLSNQEVIDNVCNKVCSGDIILFHDTESNANRMKAVLPLVIKNLKSKGYQFTRVN